jgi:hypothetical protein
MEKLMELRPMDEHLYKFPRRRVTNSQWIKDKWDRVFPHPEIFLMQKKTHAYLKGFDEDFTGGNAWQRENQAQPYPGYGIFDNHFTSKVVQRKREYGEIIDGPVITEFMEDIFGRTEDGRVFDENAIRRNKIIWREKETGVLPDSAMLRFEWKKMLEFQRRVAI